MNDASSEARKQTAAATSSGRPRRPAGAPSAACCRSASVLPSQAGVRIMPGSDSVHTNLGPVLGGEGACQRRDRTFGRVVSRMVRESDERVDRRGVDDRASGLEQVGHADLDREEHRLQRHGELTFPTFLREQMGRAALDRGGVVVNDVEAPVEPQGRRPAVVPSPRARPRHNDRGGIRRRTTRSRRPAVGRARPGRPRRSRGHPHARIAPPSQRRFHWLHPSR